MSGVMDFVGDGRTVDAHIKRLRQKLAVSGKELPWSNATVWGVGYKFDEHRGRRAVAARVSIRTRLIVSYITVTVLSLGVLGVLFSGMLSDYLFTEQEKLLLSRGQAVAEIVKDVVQGRPLTLQARIVLENMSDFLQAHVWLVDRSGLIVATSSDSTEWEGLQLDAHEFSGGNERHGGDPQGAVGAV